MAFINVRAGSVMREIRDSDAKACPARIELSFLAAAIA